MTSSDLDTVYTALAEALARVGVDRVPLLLATLGLSLLAQSSDPVQALGEIERAERLARL